MFNTLYTQNRHTHESNIHAYSHVVYTQKCIWWAAVHNSSIMFKKEEKKVEIKRGDHAYERLFENLSDKSSTWTQSAYLPQTLWVFILFHQKDIFFFFSYVRAVIFKLEVR